MKTLPPEKQEENTPFILIVKRSEDLVAISEPLRMPEKKVRIQAGFVTRWLGATGGPIFRQVFSVEVVASVRAW
jgi:hypothetical protein